MITVITIKPNNFTFNRNTYYNNLNKLKDDISSYIVLHQIDPNDLMETIVTEIGLTPELIGSSPICHETDTNIYQICYAAEKQEEIGKEKQSVNPNKIANYLVNDSIDNNCVFINSKINEHKLCVTDDANIDMLVKILYSKFIHIGVLIRADNTTPIKEFPYGDHPIEFYNVTNFDEDKYKILEFDFISLGLCAVIDMKPENNIINKRMTRIVGDQLIYGDVLLILRLPDAYQDLDFELFNKINTLSYGPMADRLLTEDEKKDTEKVNDLHVINNKYCIINARLTTMTKNYSSTCANINCTKSENKLGQCNKCFRVKYHNKECQESDWNNHKEDCLHNK
jgi:hypothetical protein